ncbi:histidine kinase [Myroides sp. JBRI-B21084]|uniref:sensor histidine kinase n=1 Tax=Myroides sp. JBRI-B21084 TaxID=3119977 RepID=UPI0026E38B91|nr:ATP-binding protein [Paenimyroides cloacae]WKW46351.1 histidine kinase [Paenimyroides cloacae]
MEKWQNADTLLIWLVVIIGVMVVLVGTLIGVFYISYKRILSSKDEELNVKMEYQRSLLKVSLEAQENERMRIAADLHDNIISKLTIIRLKTVMGARLQELDDLLGTIIDESRRISHELLPPLYEEKPLDSLLITTFKSWRCIYNVKYKVDVRTVNTIDKTTKLQTLRILQELLNNIHKHAKATHLHLTVRITNNIIVLVLKDNGVGFDTTTVNKGIGLKNIDLRADNLQARYKYKSLKNTGTRFIMFFNYA